MSDFGHKKRTVVRKKKLHATQTRADQLINDCWHDLQPHPDTAYDAFKKIIGILEAEFSTPATYSAARIRLSKFVRSLNQQTGANFPEPGLPVKIRRAEPTIGYNWIVNGKALQQIVHKAHAQWNEKTEYSYQEILGWLIFSAAIGGLNDANALLALVRAAHTRQTLFQLGISQTPVLFLRADNTSYGNELIDGDLYCTWQYLPDPTTLIWLTRAYAYPDRKKNFKFDLFRLLNTALKKITTRYQVNQLNTAASYLWMNRQGVKTNTAIGQVMQGKIQNCSLTELEFARYITHWHPAMGVNIDLQELISHPGTSVFSSKTKLSNPRDEFNRGVTRGIRNLLAEKKSEKRNEMLNTLMSTTQHEGARRLISWVGHLLNPSILPKLKISSIRRYVDAVGHAWLATTASLDVSELGSHELSTLYREMLEISTERSRAYDSGRLKQFHSYQMAHHGAPEAHFDQHNQMHICRARLIGPTLYSALLCSLANASGITEHDRAALRLIFILAYRTGMRREEIIGLQLRDVEPVKYPNLLVRPNVISSTKSSSSTRRILVSALLNASEFQEFIQFWQRQCLIKNSRPNSPLFTLENSDAPVNSQIPYLVMKQLFTEIIGTHDYVFHSFRHTALSNLGMLLSGDTQLIQWLTDYTPQDVDRIQYALLGKNTQGSDHWYALASLAGHLNPAETFRSYLHLIHLQAALNQHSAAYNFDIFLAAKLSGISESTIRRMLPNDLTPGQNNNQIDLNWLAAKQAKKLAGNIKSFTHLTGVSKNLVSDRTLEPRTEVETVVDQYTLMLTTLPGHPGNPISMELAYNILHQIESGRTIEEVATNYGVLQEVVQRWVNRAQQLAQLKTNRGQLRLYTNDRLLNNPDQILTPGKLTSISQTQQARVFFQSAVKMHQKNAEQLTHFLKTFLNRVVSSKSGIPFKSNETEQLKLFIGTGMQLLPSKNWRIESKNNEDLSAIKNDLGYRLINTSYNSELKNTGFIVSIIHPNEEQISGNKLKKYSSSILKYCGHMLSIVEIPYHDN